MQIDTFRDIIQRTRAYHQQLADMLHNSSEDQKSEKARILLDYLATHESRLSDALEAFEKYDNLKALNTWVMEFLNKKPIKPFAERGKPYADLSAEEIMSSIEYEHNQIIELYRFLVSRAVATPAVDLLEELALLEEHEAMRISQSANLLGDI